MTSLTTAIAFSTAAFLEHCEIPESRHALLTGEEWTSAASDNFRGPVGAITDSLDGWKTPDVVFRGHTDRAWGIHSTLYRTLEDELGDDPSESDMQAAERRVIDAARKPLGVPNRTSGTRLGLNLTDGQLLAVLQHHQCPTRFVDVTDDGRVALFFAVEKDDSIDGRLFIIVLEPKTQRVAKGLGEAGTWLDLGQSSTLPWQGAHRGTRNARSDWTSAVYRAAGDNLDPRMSAQRGSFLVGGMNRAYSDKNIQFERRALNAHELAALSCLPIGFRASLRRFKAGSWPAYSWTIRVPAAIKPAIRRLLADDGIDEESIYPDYDAYRQLAQAEARRI